MSWMSDLDLMIRDGARTVEDFTVMGFDQEKAEAMAELAAETEDEQ